MEHSTQNGERILRAERYSLIFPTDRPFVFVETSKGKRLLELFTFSAVNAMNGRDETYAFGEWVVKETADVVTFSIAAKSTAWQTKIYHFHCYPTRFTYSIEVEGQGQLADVQYFGGYYSGSNPRWGTGFFWSGQQFTQVFNPEPNIPEVFHFPSSAGMKIDLTGVPIPAKGDWFFTPPPFCFAGEYAEGWLALGVEAAAGQNSFTEYQYHGNLEAFHLSLSYEGHTQVDGHFTTPAIGFDFAADEYAALEAHVAALRDGGLVPIPKTDNSPDWWRTPIFCGWGAECYLATLVPNGRAPDFARQEHYNDFIAALEQNDLAPGIVVLDDKWQADYGTNAVDTDKWPDLRGFVDGQHDKGRRVLLWLKAWDPEGLPVDECVTNAAGMPMSFDPSNPAFESRLRAAVRLMLSDEGYNADGFKLDFTARIPSGPGLRPHQEIWGIELMRKYLSILYSEAKAVKSDALVMTHTPHPYLADVVDMIRLNDINIGRDVNRAMIHRAKVAKVACPEAIIDTDNWPITDKKTWEDYMRIQPDLGIPSLYYATHIDFTQEALTADDYNLIREVWAEARAKQAK